MASAQECEVEPATVQEEEEEEGNRLTAMVTDRISRKTVLLIWGTITVTATNFIYFTAGYFAFNYFQLKYYEEMENKTIILLEKQENLMARYPVLYNTSKYTTYTRSAELLCHITKNPRHHWSFWAALDFCVSIITTVGYGVLHPKTWVSKLACMLYAMAGLPLYIVMLGAAGKYIVSMFEYLNAKSSFVQKFCTYRYTELVIANVNIAIVMAIFLYAYSYFGYSASYNMKVLTNASVISLPGFGYNYTAATITTAGQNWTMTNAVYYSMISLTTIGFGDYYVGNPEEPRQAVMLFASVSFGFALFSYAFQTYAKVSEESMNYMRDKARAAANVAAHAAAAQAQAAAQAGLAHAQSAANAAASHAQSAIHGENTGESTTEV